MWTSRFKSDAAALRSRWTALESDWQSVVVGAVIVALIEALGVRVPW